MPIHDCGGSCSSSSDPFSRVRDQIQSQAICPVFRDQLSSQHCEGLQLSVRKSQFWTQQRTSLLDLAEDLPGETLAVPAAALQHLAPVALHGSVNLEQ